MNVSGGLASALSLRQLHAWCDERFGPHAVASDPVVPATIAPWISTVAGLSNLARPHPFIAPSPTVPASLATAYNGTLTPSGTTNTGGGLPPGLDGSGVTIGLLEDDGFDLYYVSNWLTFAHLPANLYKHIYVYSAVSPSGCTPLSAGCGTSEVLLDIAAVLGIAPGATIENLRWIPPTSPRPWTTP